MYLHIDQEFPTVPLQSKTRHRVFPIQNNLSTIKAIIFI